MRCLLRLFVPECRKCRYGRDIYEGRCFCPDVVEWSNRRRCEMCDRVPINLARGTLSCLLHNKPKGGGE